MYIWQESWRHYRRVLIRSSKEEMFCSSSPQHLYEKPFPDHVKRNAFASIIFAAAHDVASSGHFLFLIVIGKSSTCVWSLIHDALFSKYFTLIFCLAIHLSILLNLFSGCIAKRQVQKWHTDYTSFSSQRAGGCCSSKCAYENFCIRFLVFFVRFGSWCIL